MKRNGDFKHVLISEELFQALKERSVTRHIRLQFLADEAMRCGMEMKQWIERKSEEKQ